MKSEKAYTVLNLTPGATADAIEGAYKALAKATHPDLHGGGGDAEAQFNRVQEAYGALCKVQGSAGPDAVDEASGRERDQEAASQPVDFAVDFVTAFLERRGIVILFDGSLQDASAPRRACKPEEIAAFLDRQDMEGTWLIDEVIGEARIAGMKLSKSDAERAVRTVTRMAQVARRKAIALPLLLPVSAAEREAADVVWVRLAEAIFETEPTLSAACLRHFVWQVKRKLIEEPVEHHLMPVIWNPLQGGGKTFFVRKFLEPLGELAAGPVLLSDFTDKRSGEIYRFPALFIDDMEQIEPHLIQPLKSLVTGEHIQRRKLGSSRTQGYKQRTTLIGTANHSIDNLVADATGNRRFAALRFRNGKAETGGDPQVWETVTATDYALLWRSVDVYGPAPIAAHLPALVALQGAPQPADPILTWLLQVNVLSERIKRVRSVHGVRASDLHDVFCEQMNCVMTATAFGIRMTRHVMNPDVPFGPRVKKQSGWYYPLKVVASNPADPADPADPAGSGY